jgi:methyl-accepting chemotaxis protein
MKFLDELNFSKKLYVLLFVPTFTLIIYSLITIYGTYSDAKEHKKVKELSELSVKISNVVHETQKERGMSAGFLSSRGAKFKDQLLKQRQLTDKQVHKMFTFVEQLDLDHFQTQFSQKLEKSLEQVKTLGRMRKEVDGFSITPKEMIAMYTNMNTSLLDSIAMIVNVSSDIKVSNEINGYLNFLQAKERMGIERAVGTGALAKGSFDDGMQVYFIKLIAQQEAFLKNFHYYAPVSIIRQYQKIYTDAVVQSVSNMEKKLMNADGAEHFDIPAQQWFDNITYKINKFKEVENFQSKHLIVTAEALYEHTLYKLTLLLFGIVAIFLLVGVLTLVITKRLSEQVAKLQQGLKFFLSYVAREKDYIKPMQVDGQDEFAQMTRMINAQIEKITKIIEQDKKVVSEIEDVVKKVNNGFFGNSVKESGASVEVEHLRNSLNEMLVSTKEKFAELIHLLNNFSQGKFDYEIHHQKVRGLNGDFGAVVTSAKLLGDNISELFAVIQNSGGRLTDNTKILSKSSTNLTNAANRQYEALGNMTNVLQHMQETTKASIQDIRESASMADKLTHTSDQGLVLATKTAAAADEINEKVEAIDAAIEIIDQIAFQTNILSLNAAVEAATAGDAGKGFSVVAQEVRNLATKSAEAAAEIKLLVESAKVKSTEGKVISEEMIKGYHNLKNEINTTKNVIEKVEYKSVIQEKDMSEIDSAVEKMKLVVSENVDIAANIENLSKDITTLSTNLFHIVSTASFKEEIRDQVCDVKLNEMIAQMKHKHLMFKAKILEKLEDKMRFDVTSTSDCDLGRWMREQENKKSDITQSAAWSVLINDHEKIHALAQEYVNKNAENVASTQLEDIATQLEHATVNIFKSLDGIKRAYCNTKKEGRIIELTREKRKIQA